MRLPGQFSAANQPAPPVMLWAAHLQAWEVTPAAWLGLLDGAERAQCRLFRKPADGLAYAAAHALLRCALGACLGLPAATLRFARDPMGKPFLCTTTPTLIDFSLSHTHGMVAVAISQTGPVGVDVEAIEPKNVPRQDWGAFGLSAEESTHLAMLCEPLQTTTFLAWWTAREAVAKADGRGLTLPLERIRIDGSGQLATVQAQADEVEQHWHLWRYQPSGSHTLALASQPHSRELICTGFGQPVFSGSKALRDSALAPASKQLANAGARVAHEFLRVTGSSATGMEVWWQSWPQAADAS